MQGRSPTGVPFGTLGGIGERLVLVRRRAGTTVLGLATVGVALLTVLRLLSFRGSQYVAAALALVPYLAGFAAVLTLACLMLRRRRLALAAVVLTAVLVATLLPRLLPNEQPPARGETLRVMALNLYFGRADAAEVVEKVRSHDVDLLCLLELTPEAVSELRTAGLFEELPNAALRPADGGGGVGILSSYTLTPHPSSAKAGYAATVQFPGPGSLDVVAVHTLTPLTSVTAWRSNLAALPPASTRTEGRSRILAGDFNATLDHAALRDVLDAGYVDAAAQRGEGLNPTWPGKLFPPPVTIDHILAGKQTAVREYATFDIGGSDHDAVYAEVTLPT